VVVSIDAPIPFSTYGKLDDDQVTELLRARIDHCFQDARRRRRQML
jgi:hypothetical protein